MSNLTEISCRNCGCPISITEAWDRSSKNTAPGDWTPKSCVMCGGTISVYKRWIDTPTAHVTCTEQGWHDEPCTMCFGPMERGADDDVEQKYHAACAPENWFERECAVCELPIRIHRDWDDQPTTHRNCIVVEWYEKDCQYCGSTLKLHVEWERPPVVHAACEQFVDEEMEMLEPETETAELIAEPLYLDADEADELIDICGIGGPESHEIEIVHMDGHRTTIQSMYSVPEPSAVEQETIWATDITDDAQTDAVDITFEPIDDSEYACSGCGKQLVELNGFSRVPHAASEIASFCKECENDALLVAASVEAMRKRLPFAVDVATETRTRTVIETVAVIVNAESDEPVAEVKMMDDGVFSSERVAVAYEPRTGHRYSRTVFGSKGFFSGLRTTDTYDRDGKLLHHARPGNGNGTANGNGDNSADGAVQVAKNRFLFKRG